MRNFGWFGWRGRLDFRHIALQHGRVVNKHNVKYGYNGSTGRLTHLLAAAAALNAHGTNASPGGLCARTHKRNLLVLARVVVIRKVSNVFFF